LSLLSKVSEMFSSSKDTPQVKFWKWFEANGTRLLDFEKDQDRLFENLRAELHKVHPDLTFEFSGKNDGAREFVISADGNKGAFPMVIALADAAPSLPNWKIIKFRQPREFTKINFQGLEVGAEQVQFTIEPDGDKVGVTLFIDGYVESDPQYKIIGFLLLDACLGEYDVEMNVGFIEFKTAAEESALPKLPLTELPNVFSQLVFSMASGPGSDAVN
jgi:hypothetical protein